MKAASLVQSAASVQMRLEVRLMLSRQAPVLSRATRPGQVPEKLLAKQQRIVFAGDAVAGVRTISPMDEDADERIVERAEFADGLVGPCQKAGHDIGSAAEFAEGLLQLLGRLVRLRPRPFVGLGAIIAGPENADLFHGNLLRLARYGGHSGRRRQGRQAFAQPLGASGEAASGCRCSSALVVRGGSLVGRRMRMARRVGMLGRGHPGFLHYLLNLMLHGLHGDARCGSGAGDRPNLPGDTTSEKSVSPRRAVATT